MELEKLNALLAHKTVVIDDAQTGIYIVPTDKFGFCLYPVTHKVVKQVTRALDDGQQETVEEVQEELDDGAILVDFDTFAALHEEKRRFCFKDGKCVPYVEPEELTQINNMLAEYDAAQKEYNECMYWLKEHDYVGIKLAEIIFTGEQTDVDEMKQKYADVLTEANAKRTRINELEQYFASQDWNALKTRRHKLIIE